MSPHLNNPIVFPKGAPIYPESLWGIQEAKDFGDSWTLNISTPLYRGFIDELKLDTQQLEEGIFSVSSFKGILPGGTRIFIPWTDGLSPRSIDENSELSSRTVEVFIALPLSQSYKTERISVEGGMPQPIAKKNLRILFERKRLKQYKVLKIAEVQKHNDQFRLNDRYIPPCLRVSASPRLMQIVQDVKNRLITKSNQLRGDSGMLDSFNNFQLLQLINSRIPLLNDFAKGLDHPRIVFHALVELAGALTAFSREIGPQDLPSYNHNDLSSTFGSLHTMIINLLKARYCTAIPIERPSETSDGLDAHLFLATIDADLAEATFYIGAKGHGNSEVLIENIVSRAKVAPEDQIVNVVERNLVGIEFHYEAHPPIKNGLSYFLLDSWDTRQSNRLAIYVPSCCGEVELELVAVTE